MSERTVDLFDAGTATAPGAGWDGMYGGDLQRGEEEEERANRMRGMVNNRKQSNGEG